MSYKQSIDKYYPNKEIFNRVYPILDKYFKLLDEEPLKSNSLFSTHDDKEKYETSFMYAFRKYRAALYHLENISRLKNNDFKKVGIRRMPNTKISHSRFKYKTKTSFSADYYVYELSAFLEALKSCLDFLAAAIECHLKGIQLDSLTTLKKLAKK